MEVGGPDEQGGRRLVGDRGADHGVGLWASGPNGRRCCGWPVRVLRSVSWVVHSWSETIPFQGASTSCSPSSIALARTTSSSALSKATLAIARRYNRIGSSIPIRSATSGFSSSADGSSCVAGTSSADAPSMTAAPALARVGRFEARFASSISTPGPARSRGEKVLDELRVVRVASYEDGCLL